MKYQECKTQDLQLIRIVIPVYNFAITSVMIGISGAYIEGELCPEFILFMAFIAKIIAVLDDGGKLLYACVLRRNGHVPCKLLIDMTLGRSYILMGGMRLHEKA